MFSILKKPQNTINADDLELLQNEIERHLVNNVKQRWKLERLVDSSTIISPDFSANSAPGSTGFGTTTKNTGVSSQSNSSLPGGKLRNSLKHGQIEAQSEDATDGFRNSIYATNNSANGGSYGPDSNETDSISSESSLTSILTGSTIITANLADSNQQPISNKRSLKNSTNDRPSKRFRPNSSNSMPTAGALPKRPPHSKHRSKILPSKYRNSIEESRPDTKQVLKNEAPDKLWPFVEQFCIPPTEQQIAELKEMLMSLENDKEYYIIPPTMKEESPETPTKTDDASSNHVNSKHQRKSKSKADDEASLGALTQRLVSSFIEDGDDSSADQSRSGSDASSSPTKKRRSKVSKCLDVDDANNVEKRIRQQLEEHSILSSQDEIPYFSEQNDTLRELSAKQHELLSVQSDIEQTIKNFIDGAEKRNNLDTARAELEEANLDVRSAYYRYISAKQKKRNPTKKERDAAYRAVQEHQAIFEKCDELYRLTLNRSNNC